MFVSIKKPTWSTKKGVSTRKCKGLVLVHNNSEPVECGGNLLFSGSTETYYIFLCDQCGRKELVTKPKTHQETERMEDKISSCPS